MNQETRDKSSLKLMRVARYGGYIALALGISEMFYTHQETAIAVCIVASLEIAVATWFVNTWIKEMKENAQS